MAIEGFNKLSPLYAHPKCLHFEGNGIESCVLSTCGPCCFEFFPWPRASRIGPTTRNMVLIHTHGPVHHRTPADCVRD